MFTSSPFSDSLLKKDEASERTDPEILRKEFLYTLPMFSKQTYFMMRPIENFHIYLWILKDLAWAQDWDYPAMIFGGLAVGWCLVLLYEAIFLENLYEVYMVVGTTLWLIANFIWMTGK
jgi:hypothetical protein